MVTSCCAYGCAKRFKKGENVGFYCFPKDPALKLLWIKALKRHNWTPSSSSRICGKHFQNGKPSLDKNHPDYVPNVFKFNPPQKSAAIYDERLKILMERRHVHKESQQTSTTMRLESQPPQESTDVSDSAPQQQSDVPRDEDLQENIRHLEQQIQLLQIENGRLKNEINQFETEMNFLRAEKISFKESATKFHPVNSILEDPKRLLLYTGLKSHELFHHIIKMMRDDFKDTESLSIEAQFIIVLMKIKLNLLSSDIAFRFNVSRKTVLRVYEKWFPILSSKLSYKLIRWPNSKANQEILSGIFEAQ